MARALAVFLLLLPACSLEPWETRQKVEATWCVAALTADAVTTAFVSHTPGLQENNPILGHHPSDPIVAVYFAGSTLLVLGVAEILPGYWRDALLAGCGAVESGWVVNNLLLL